jgi:diguanylate cyclase (GGDEF)-like protein
MPVTGALDVYTLGVIGLAVGVAISLSFTLLGMALRGMPALQIWAAAFWVLTLAGFAGGYDEQVTFLSSIVGSALIAVGNALMLVGIALHIGYPLRRRWPLALVLCFLAVQVAFLLAPPSAPVEAAVFGLKSVAWDGWMIWLLLRRAPRDLRIGCAFTAGVFCIDILFYLVRGAVALHPAFEAHVMFARALAVSNYLFGILCSFLLSTGFTLMLAQRFTQVMRHAANTDGLTGLLNRTAVVRAGERLVAEHHAQGGGTAVLMFDLDNFKAINDRWGHSAGDAVLKHFVATVRDEGMPSGALFSRYGGEEFLLVVPGMAGAPALALAEQLRAGVARRPASFARHDIAFTTSVGIATSMDGNLAGLIDAADRALYLAKDAGRNRAITA